MSFKDKLQSEHSSSINDQSSVLNQLKKRNTKESLVENKHTSNIKTSKQGSDILTIKRQSGELTRSNKPDEQVEDDVLAVRPNGVYAELFEDVSIIDEDGYEETIEEYETIVRNVNDDSTRQSVVVRRRRPVNKDTTAGKEKKKEVTYNEVVLLNELDNEEDNESYIWVKEEVDEEVEVETDEESINEEEEEEKEIEQDEQEHEEHKEEEIEEDLEEQQEEEKGKEKQEEVEHLDLEVETGIVEKVEEIEDEEITEMLVEDEEEEELQYKDEIEDDLSELEEVVEDLNEGKIDELEEQHISETEKEEIVEETMGEFEEAAKALEDVEEEIEEEEEEEELPRKRKRKLKTIKVFRMVRRRRTDVISELQKQAELPEDLLETSQLQSEVELEKEKEEIAKKEWEEQVELVKGIAAELMALRRKNRNLSKTIIEYYKRRSENVQEFDQPQNEVLQRYFKRLHVLKEYKKATNSEMTRIADEVNELKKELSTLTNDYDKEKDELLSWEAELGKGLAFQTGYPLEESAINHLVQRHEVLLNRLSKERLQLVTLENQIAVKETSLKNLVVFEGNLSLMDYEQLRMDNQIFSEKLEERDNELAHLRKKVLEIIHIHAHVLEKSDAVTDGIENCSSKDHRMNYKVNEMREKVNKLRKMRDKIREKSNRLRKGAGLLIRPKLAVNYAESVNNIKISKQEVARLIKTFNEQKKTIEVLRKQILETNASDDLATHLF